jgi:hypothetical protein
MLIAVVGVTIVAFLQNTSEQALDTKGKQRVGRAKEYEIYAVLSIY